MKMVLEWPGMDAETARRKRISSLRDAGRHFIIDGWDVVAVTDTGEFTVTDRMTFKDSEE